MRTHSEKSPAALLAMVAVIPVAAIVNGWCLTVMWSWFIVPLGVPSIGIAHAIGLAMVISVLTQGSSVRSDRSPAESIGIALLLWPIMTAMASIPHAFM